jgi:predicted polyphosphate/ATP-dependent NAD kinase
MTSETKKKLGLIINPVAGLGGTVGLKGSDGAEIQKKALELGAIPQSEGRTVQALEGLRSLVEGLEVLAYPEEMGGRVAQEGGFETKLIGAIQCGNTTADDTISAAQEMQLRGVDLLLFAGGDGTARDIYEAVGDGVVALGIPAGVKIHSPVYARSPTASGTLAALYLSGRTSSVREAEVMDIDEDAVREGFLSARLYGYLMIPFRRRLLQGSKTASSPTELAAMRAIARHVVEGMQEDCLYIIGPGTTTRAIADELGQPKTLIGVDVLLGGELVASDVNESQILELLKGREAKIVVTPIGGQGYIFGRGNQQLSHGVIRQVGKDNIIVVSTVGKINSLRGRSLLVDTGDRTTDERLTGYLRVVTGYNEEIVYRAAC